MRTLVPVGMRRLVLAALMALAALALVACGGGDDDQDGGGARETPAATTPAAPGDKGATTPATPTPAAAPAGLITDLADVENAVVRIVAEGSFRDPDFGEVLNSAGSGTGFIIDPSGIAVTNNHVVTGAALLRVYVPGKEDPVNARILGVSECSDLAVIDLTGEGYPYLAWYEDPPRTGLDVYAAGHPLGDPEFTLTSGIISKADADGESSWASVDAVLEHDAQLNPGNSGGPLVTEDGRVVGVNYAGAFETNQMFAIRAEEALRILEQLQGGQNVTSIGVNGQAVITADGTSGIWVASVKSGSPADEVGIKGGDIITRIEGLLLSTDGTMADYCDILRTHEPTDVLSIEVLRYDTSEVLEGRLNTPERLVQSFSFASEFEDTVPDTSGGGGGGYSGYRTVENETGALIVDVPVEWDDVDGSPWVIEGAIVGASITAAPSIDAFLSSWTTPGVFFGASADLAGQVDVNGMLDLVQQQFNFADACTYTGRFDYSDPAYTGAFDQFENCGGEGVTYFSVAAEPEDRAFIISVQIQVVTDEDLEALDQILNTFFVVDEL